MFGQFGGLGVCYYHSTHNMCYYILPRGTSIIEKQLLLINLDRIIRLFPHRLKFILLQWETLSTSEKHKTASILPKNTF